MNANPTELLLLLLSPFIGSFLALLADRLPRGEDVIRARSRCRVCDRGLTMRDLVPMLSFALTRGRCRHCGAVIPPWLLYTEIQAAGLAVLAVLAAPDTVHAFCYAVFLWLLLTLATCDLTRYRLPDVLTAALFAVALWLALLPDGIGVQAALLGAVGGAGAFGLIRYGYHLIRQREGLGLGDVKLMAGLGAYAGLRDLPLLVLVAALTALAAGLIFAFRQNRRTAKTPLGQRALPFGAALCGAAAVLWLARMTNLVLV